MVFFSEEGGAGRERPAFPGGEAWKERLRCKIGQAMRISMAAASFGGAE